MMVMSMLCIEVNVLVCVVLCSVCYVYLLEYVNVLFYFFFLLVVWW